jgi:hypothetical protein
MHRRVTARAGHQVGAEQEANQGQNIPRILRKIFRNDHKKTDKNDNYPDSDLSWPETAHAGPALGRAVRSRTA